MVVDVRRNEDIHRFPGKIGESSAAQPVALDATAGVRPDGTSLIAAFDGADVVTCGARGRPRFRR